MLLPEEYEFLTSLGQPTSVIRGWIYEKMNDELRYGIEIKKRDEIIARAQAEKEALKIALANARKVIPAADGLEQHRLKALKGLLSKPLPNWTPLNKQAAVEGGKFKDWTEAEPWIKSHQNGNGGQLPHAKSCEACHSSFR